MNNSQDPKFSKFSYVNKDFASIYPELLDLASQLTDKWHPANSNESDPGVVLLKEGAFMADHINYNTDKNILEAFLPTATQESSVRDIVQRGGYIPNYYISGKGKVSFKFNFDADDNKFKDIFTIPPFTLNITNKEGTVWYVQADQLSIDGTGHGECNFIQGYVEDLEINDSTNITLENIDDDLRVYLPVNNVAQNGIFIRNSNNARLNWSGELWEKETFLNILPQYTKAYKVEYDSEKDKVYIEFPSDLSAIIGSGLNIRYIVSDGLKGNVPADYLTVIQSPTEYKITEDFSISMKNFTLYNPGSIDNGRDPETISEMYHNFKETVGTFNTLVTCRDYSNAIKSMVNNYDKKIVSNAVVTDSTNDYSNTVDIITYDNYGKYVKPALKRDLDDLIKNSPLGRDVTLRSDDGEENSKIKSNWLELLSYINNNYQGISNNDLKLCALRSYTSGKYNKDKPSYLMELTYKPILPTKSLDFSDDNGVTLNGIKESLKDYKCISTSFKSKNPGEVYYFRVDTPLHIQVTTYNKINSKTEFQSIQQSIYKTITEKYNSSMIDFGEALDLDEVYQSILNADERIKNIYITQEDDETDTKVISYDGVGIKETSLNVENEGKELILELVAKNILAGRLCLFNFIYDFNYNYGQTENKYYGNTTDSSNPNGSLEDLSSSDSIIDDSTIGSINTNTKIYTSNIYEPISQDSKLPTNYKKIKTTELFSKEYTLYNNSTIKVTGLNETSKIEIYYDDDDETEPVSIDSGSVIITNISDKEVILNDDYNITTSGLVFYKYNDQEVSTTTNTENTSTASDDEITIKLNIFKDNHYLYVAQPNYMDDQVFPVYCYYRLTGPAANNMDDLKKIIIKKNEDTEIPVGYNLYLSYKKDGVNKFVEFGPGDVILSTIDISLADFYTLPSDENELKEQETRWEVTESYLKELYEKNRMKLNKLSGKDGAGFRIISANDTIRSRVLLRTSISDRILPCYWIRSTPGCELFSYTYSISDGLIFTDSNTFEYNGEICTILNNNEYFFYSDQNRRDFVMFGPGTMISIPISFANYLNNSSFWSGWGIDPEDQLSLDILETNGLSSGIPFIDINLKSENPSDNFSLNLTEMSIITLGNGDVLSIGGSFNPDIIKNDDVGNIYTTDNFTLGFGTPWYPLLNSTLSYKQKDEDGKVEENSISTTNVGTFIKTEYQISTNPATLTSSFTEVDNDYCYITESIEYNSNSYISSEEINETVKIMSNIDLTGLNSTSIAMSEKLNLKLMTYQISPVTYITEDEESKEEKQYLYPGDPIRENLLENKDLLDYSEYKEITFSSNYNKGNTFEVLAPFFFDRGNKAPEVIIIRDEDDQIISTDLPPDPHNNYIIPILLSGDYNELADKLSANISYKLELPETDTEIEGDLSLYQFGSVLENKDEVKPFIFNKNQNFYQLTFDLDENIKDSCTLYLNFKYDNNLEVNSETGLSIDTSTEMIVNVLPLKVYNGINSDLAISDNTLGEVVNKMNYIVDNSTGSGTNIYYINEPDNTIDIQDEKILIPETKVFNPNFLFDKNNIANHQTIPMIDLNNTEIFLTKSVKGYRE